MKIAGVMIALSAVFTGSVVARAQEFAGSVVARAQDIAWEKSYPVGNQAKLVFETGDSGLTVRSCGSCNQVHVKVILKNMQLSGFNLQEGGSGSGVNFSLKEKSHMGWHTDWHGPERKSEVVVETPAEVSLDARTSDGGLTVSGLRGEMKLQASDGGMKVRECSGTLEARSSDGGMDVAGAFTAIHLHSSDGGIKADLSKGGNLSAESRVESSDGGVSLVLPKNFAAEFDIHTSDGGLVSNLPILMDGYNSKGGSGHNVHGKMNGGGALLTIHTSDGGVQLSTAG